MMTASKMKNNNNKNLRQPRWLISMTCVLMLAITGPEIAQIPGLTPQQQALLQQLPPNQRQALLNRLTSSQSAASTAESGTADALSETSLLEAQLPAEIAPADEEPRFAAGDSLVVFLNVPDDLEIEPDLEQVKSLAEAGNPYKLDARGVLLLPGTGGISLAGLTEDLAQVRLEADPLLVGLDIEIVLLPLERFGAAALEPYGYEVFEQRLSRAGARNQPVPAAYVVGPGDTVRVQLYGAQSVTYELPIDRDGVLSVPEIGPVTVAGLTFDSMREEISRRVADTLIGTEASVTLTELRSVQVFLAGDVESPGTHLVSAMATMLDVLTAGGGVLHSGSLRDIRLNRGGSTVATFDAYQLLLFGDDRGNRRVRDGDVVFVAPVGQRVSISGAVRRPAIYEIRNSLNASGALQLAGGTTARALTSASRLQRIDPENGLEVVSVDLTNPKGRSIALKAGDVLVVPGDTDQVDRAVELIGHVYRPGLHDWTEGLRLSELLSSSRDLLPEADTGYILIERQTVPNGDIEVLSADLERVWSQRGGADDLALKGRDRIYVFSRTPDQNRNVFMRDILDKLTRQATSAGPSAIARIGGTVNAPGDYPLEAGMTVSDLLRAGGGLAESAYRRTAELSRYETDGNGARNAVLIEVDLDSVLNGDLAADMALQPFDYLNIKQITRWEAEQIVEIRGEVVFPGEYPVYRGESLSSLLERAGGLTEFAFPEGSIFTRETLKQREREQLDSLASRIESDLAALALSDTAQSEALSIGRSLLSQIENTDPAGRLVISLDSILSGANERDVLLRDGDLLVVPPKSQEVTVIGEVQYATSHLWESGVDRDEYIARSGGATVKADKRRTYVVRANGEVVVGNRSRFFARSRGFDVRPGDTIVVPLDTDRVKPLVLWSSATQILYNLAIAAAAVNSF